MKLLLDLFMMQNEYFTRKCGGTRDIRQKTIMTNRSANCCVLLENLQLFIVFLWLQPVHSCFQGLLGVWKTPFLHFEIFKFLPPGGAGCIYFFSYFPYFVHVAHSCLVVFCMRSTVFYLLIKMQEKNKRNSKEISFWGFIQLAKKRYTRL